LIYGVWELRNPDEKKYRPSEEITQLLFLGNIL